MDTGDSTTIGVPFVRAAVAVDVEAAIERRGGDSKAIFEAAQIELKDVAAVHSLIRLDQLTHLFELAAIGTKCPHLALEVASYLDLTKWGAFGYAIINSPAIGEALANMCAFFGALQTGANINFVTDSDSFGIEYSISHPAVRYKRQDAEHFISSIKGLVQRLRARNTHPVAVYFEHEALSPLATYKNYLGVKPHFNMHTNSILFPKWLENTPVINADAHLFLVLKRHVQELQQDLPPEGSLADSIKYRIRHLLPTGECSLGKIAQDLGIEMRTLQRRLNQSELSYRQLLDDARAELAIRHLKSPSMTLKEISYLTGFGEVSAFLKAFKKWTGQTPGQYRSIGQ